MSKYALCSLLALQAFLMAGHGALHGYQEAQIREYKRLLGMTLSELSNVKVKVGS